MAKPSTAIAVLFCAASVLGGCAQNQDPDPISREELAERLQQAGRPEDFAECVADELYPELSTDEREALARDDAEDTDQEAALLDKAEAAGTVCTQRGVSPNE